MQAIVPGRPACPGIKVSSIILVRTATKLTMFADDLEIGTLCTSKVKIVVWRSSYFHCGSRISIQMFSLHQVGGARAQTPRRKPRQHFTSKTRRRETHLSLPRIAPAPLQEDPSPSCHRAPPKPRELSASPARNHISFRGAILRGESARLEK